MTNYYKKLRTLCHENYIGSEKCKHCTKGYLVESDDLEYNKGYTCNTCKGKGYTIPWSKGCRLSNGDEIVQGNAYISAGGNSKNSFFADIGNDVFRISGSALWVYDGGKLVLKRTIEDMLEQGIENLGIPLTLRDILRLATKNKNTVSLLENLHIHSRLNEEMESRTATIDLTKSIEDQDPEVLQAIYEMCK